MMTNDRTPNHRIVAVTAMLTVILTGLALAAGAGPAQANSHAKDSGNKVLAMVDGKPIRQRDINTPEVAKAREEAYKLEKNELASLAIKRLRAQRPKEFPQPSLKITDAEIKAVYGRANLSERGPLEAFEERIREFIIADRRAKHDQDLFDKAVRKGYVKSRLLAPLPFRYRVRFEKRAASRGPANAPVHIVEWSDFQ